MVDRINPHTQGLLTHTLKIRGKNTITIFSITIFSRRVSSISPQPITCIFHLEVKEDKNVYSYISILVVEPTKNMQFVCILLHT